jgi:hypothetical protein
MEVRGTFVSGISDSQSLIKKSLVYHCPCRQRIFGTNYLVTWTFFPMSQAWMAQEASWHIIVTCWSHVRNSERISADNWHFSHWHHHCLCAPLFFR